MPPILLTAMREPYQNPECDKLTKKPSSEKKKIDKIGTSITTCISMPKANKQVSRFLLAIIFRLLASKFGIGYAGQNLLFWGSPTCKYRETS